ncbi:MAG: hypothetical protein NWF05_05290 [Candidatus Bathyarchaeota archaeon]|nr:hypothetical protein [Candidatus Bathyarchaeota archaeon]
MSREGSTQIRILTVLSDGKPRTSKELNWELRLGSNAVESALGRMWRGGRILRTDKPSISHDTVFKGRAGKVSNQRQYHSYLLGQRATVFQGQRFVPYNKEFLDKRGSKDGKSKAELIREFIEKNRERAFYSKELVERLKGKGVKPSDIMSNVRRFEKKGLIYVRGYRMHDKQTPFKDGYLLTWIDKGKPREQAIEEAIQRTSAVLDSTASTSPIIERIHMIRDLIIEATKLRDLLSFEFIQNKLNCSPYEAESAISRALQLYPDLQAVKLFGAYNYYYHTSLAEEELKVATTFKQNYVRQMKGQQNRIGHNWEAAVEWFIDKFTVGAVFQTQKHRTKAMDPRRITLHLMKSVGDRKHNAEVDRVWSVTPGIFAQPITYVLECKWGLVQKRQIDDFLEVLRWSTEFGVSTSEGRSIKQGVVGVFAGSAFDPKESVKLKDQKISLAAYAARINIQLLRAADFNQKLREKGVPKDVTVQSVCRVAKNEKEVRETLTAIWEKPEKSGKILAKVVNRNEGVYEFEKMLKTS